MATAKQKRVPAGSSAGGQFGDSTASGTTSEGGLSLVQPEPGPPPGELEGLLIDLDNLCTQLEGTTGRVAGTFEPVLAPAEPQPGFDSRPAQTRFAGLLSGSLARLASVGADLEHTCDRARL